MKIGLDFDDVIALSHALKPFAAKELFGVEIPMISFKRKSVVGKGILTDEQYTAVGREVYSGKYEPKEVPGALDGIKTLQDLGHSVQIVTNRSDEWNTLEPAKRWLALRGLDLPITGLVYGTSKASACQGLDLFADDDSGNIRSLLGVVPHLLLFSWPHEGHLSPPQGAKMVYTWSDVLQYVKMVG